MKVKEESEKADLRFNIQKTKIMTPGSITSWQIDGSGNGNSERFSFLASKFTVDDDCSHKIKILPPWKKSYDKPRQCVKKWRCLFANRSPYSQNYGFS